MFGRIVFPITRRKTKSLEETPTALSAGEETDQARLKLRDEERRLASGALGATPTAAEEINVRLDRL